MLDSAIEQFLNDRKAGWLKKKIKSGTTDEEKEALEKLGAEEFSLDVWLPYAAKRAKQLSLVSHPGKFSNPSAKTTNIIAEGVSKPDGLLRSGNVLTELDVLGNAAALDVFKFLSLKIEDGNTVLYHLENKTKVIREQLTVPSLPFTEIEKGLLAIKQNDGEIIKTSGKVKQVYFPVTNENEYHLLSILTPSTIMFALKDRIRTMHFSEITKEARESKKGNKQNDEGFSEVYGLSVVGFGGTKPQNISVLNSNNGGAAYLLSSIPPSLNDRKIHPPKRDFFTDSLWLKRFEEDFQNFHSLLVSDPNNVHIRRKRDQIIKSIIYQVVDRLWQVRYLEAGWSESDNYRNLPGYQKIWLDQKYQEQRQTDISWFDAVQSRLARWFGSAYKELIGTKALPLGDDLVTHLKSIISECEGGLL